MQKFFDQQLVLNGSWGQSSFGQSVFMEGHRLGFLNQLEHLLKHVLPLLQNAALQCGIPNDVPPLIHHVCLPVFPGVVISVHCFFCLLLSYIFTVLCDFYITSLLRKSLFVSSTFKLYWSHEAVNPLPSILLPKSTPLLHSTSNFTMPRSTA